MASVQTFALPHYEEYPVHVALFKDVTNAAFLRSQLLASNPDFDYAFLDASMILTPNHLLTSTFLALHTFLTKRAKTRTPHSELVFRLSPNNNIGESYKKFGIGDATTAIIAVKLPITADATVDASITAETVSKHLGNVVQGTSVRIGEQGEGLGLWCDVDKVRKMYKLGGEGGNKGKKTGAANGDARVKKEGDEKKEMESVILGIIALKGS
ncbi:CGI-121-domain-containing protein [Clathrospora elynae]|uniref:EKC/KEOPS complex subunit CGI121 n=1 Tax=Clathrospora elynae TaxID=706981 RepID=A0A6A5SUF2_9PLEO|nr:CGI-121-domain-containing protein [Clathrospora elynae]